MVQIWRAYSGYLPLLVLVFVVLAVVGWGVFAGRVRSGQARASALRTTALDLLLACYFAAILVITLLPTGWSPEGYGPRALGLVPGRSIAMFIEDPSITAPLAEFLLNIAMWVPFPLLLGLRRPRVAQRALVGWGVATASPSRRCNG